jgi:hypothetical protein
MSKIIHVCARGPLPVSIETRLYTICRALEPDHLKFRTPRVAIHGQCAYGVVNPTRSMLEEEGSVVVGSLFARPDNWTAADAGPLDGSFAIFRDSDLTFEIVSDPVGSRTIWYYADEEIFISSTSQRALVMFLGSFELDPTILPWIFSTGTLGPTRSWDRRIERLPPDSTVTLNKETWVVSQRSASFEFVLRDEPNEQHEVRLTDAIASTVATLLPDFSRWVLPLSGGYDSRGILCLLRDAGQALDELQTVTWGLDSALADPKSDAHVAQQLAKAVGAPHRYYKTDLPDEPIEMIFERFFAMGEGRVDHVSGYMDGFQIWKDLYEDGVENVIRGDEGFGWSNVSSARMVRLKVGCALCSDFTNLQDIERHGFAPQSLPESLQQQVDESLETWRDRLYHEYRIPTILAGLSDLKLAYVELVNPLLSRRILDEVRQEPDALRTKKALFRKIVERLSPDVPYATTSATAKRTDIFKQDAVVQMMTAELTSEAAKSVMPASFLAELSQALTTQVRSTTSPRKRPGFKGLAKRLVPRFLRNAKRTELTQVDLSALAFRAYLISRMNALLTADAKRVSP